MAEHLKISRTANDKVAACQEIFQGSRCISVYFMEQFFFTVFIFVRRAFFILYP